MTHSTMPEPGAESNEAGGLNDVLAEIDFIEEALPQCPTTALLGDLQGFLLGRYRRALRLVGL